MNERVLIVAHGHPDKCKGGAEVAAYHEFQELRARGVDVTFLARDGGPAHGGSAFSSHKGDRELLFHTSLGDSFTFRSKTSSHIWRDFRGLLERINPTIVHFHHFVHMGLEIIREARTSCPDAKLVLTLHEYLAICHHNGQMVKRGTLRLCTEATPAACAGCYSERTTADFFMRERYVKSLLADIDLFVAPSEFLAKRYRDWGLPGDKLIILENGHPQAMERTAEGASPQSLHRRFAFFGQINSYKGLDVLLDAFLLIPEDERNKLHLDIHGANLEVQTKEYKKWFAKRLETLTKSVTSHGPYEHEQLPALMQNCGWVVVPSIWWENSPMVIQEAFLHQRPVICSNIGGMAEKVQDNVDGLHFHMGDASALARTLLLAAENVELLSRLKGGITKAPTVAQWVAQQYEAFSKEAGQHHPTI